MDGPKWEAADWAVKKFLSGLTERDTFALGLFHNNTRWFAGGSLQAKADVVAEAVRFLERYRDSGGTELGVALEQALGRKRAALEQTRHVLVITDAEVNDASRILRLADREARRADRRRISVLCIDAAPNSFMARELAERGGGVARFLTSSPEEEDITTALDEILNDWAQPLLTGLRLRVNRPGLQAAGQRVAADVQSGWSEIDLGDLPTGRSVWVYGRIPRADSILDFSLLTADGRERATRSVEAMTGIGQFPAIKTLFGTRRVKALEYLVSAGWDVDELRETLIRLGYDPAEIQSGEAERQDRVYAENTRADAGEALRALLVREALSYGLVSEETAFVAVRTESGRQVEGQVAVANGKPAGWSDSLLFGVGYGVACSVPVAYAVPAVGERLLQQWSMLGSDSETLADSRHRQGQAQWQMNVLESDFETATSWDSDVVVFSGIPAFADGQAVLCDTLRAEDAGKIAADSRIARLEVRFLFDKPGPEIDAGLALFIYVDDILTPRARVRLKDLFEQGGTRPLNIRRIKDTLVRVVLVDPNAAWAVDAPAIEVVLAVTRLT